MSRHYYNRMVACQLNKYISPIELIDIIQDYAEEIWYIQVGTIRKRANSYDLAIRMAKKEMVDQIEVALLENHASRYRPPVPLKCRHLVEKFESHLRFKSKSDVMNLDFTQLEKWCDIFFIECRVELLL